jgi:hypothetical protein
MPVIALSLVLQVVFVFHIFKTGRDTRWVWLVLMLPGFGAAIYFIIEILPELMGSSTGRQARRTAEGLINPNKDINAASRNLEVADTVENNRRLAGEQMERGQYAEASELYQKCLTGLNKHNPEFMYGYARCQFELGNHSQVRAILDSLIEENPDYKNQDAHLLYARTLDKLGEIPEATDEYKTLHSYYSGPEATYHYAKMLQANGRADKAKELLQGILDKARLSAPHYTKMHKKWINLARQEL